MKKIVSAFLAGALMMVSVQAFGDSISQIGKKIQTEYTVTVDGQQLSVPAIAVDGKSYAPVRAIGEVAGYDIAVTGKSITLNTKENVSVADSTPAPEVIDPVPVQKPTQSDLDITVSKMNALKSKMVKVSNDITFAEINLKDKPGSADLTNKINEYKSQYEILEKEYKELQAHLVELQK